MSAEKTLKEAINGLEKLSLREKIYVQHYDTSVKNEDRLYIDGKFYFELVALSRALSQLNINHSLNGFDSRTPNFLFIYIDEKNKALQDSGFAAALKIQYEKELAELQKDLFYVKDNGGVSLGIKVSISTALLIALAVVLGVIGAPIIAPIVLGIIAVIGITASAYCIYNSVEITKNGDGGGTAPSQEGKEINVEMQHVSNFQDPSFKKVLEKPKIGVDSEQTSSQQPTDPKKSSTPELQKKG